MIVTVQVSLAKRNNRASRGKPKKKILYKKDNELENQLLSVAYKTNSRVQSLSQSR